MFIRFIMMCAASFTLLSGCMSLVFAKSEYSELPKGTYTVDLTHASIVWRVSHLGLSRYVARFTRFDASVDFDPKNIASSSVRASIDPMSIQTAYPNAEQTDFDSTLATDKGWFNASAYPSIEFVSTKITMTSDSTAEMTGDLTFLGVTKPVTLAVSFNGAMAKQPFTGKPTMGFSATTTLDRTQWNMTKYAPQIGAEVEVLIEGEFVKTSS